MKALALLACLASAMLAARAQSPYDFKVETPINKLSVPVNFTQTLYAEATKSVGLSFWQMTDLQAPDHLRRFMGFYADSHDHKATYKITFDWKERTATVTENFIDVNDQAKESLEAFKITNFDLRAHALIHRALSASRSKAGPERSQSRP